jgi:hypothetical protein
LYDSNIGLAHGAVSFLPGPQHGTLPPNPYPFREGIGKDINWKLILTWGASIVVALVILVIIGAIIRK